MFEDLNKSQIDEVLFREYDGRRFSDMSSGEFCRACYCLLDNVPAFLDGTVSLLKRIKSVSVYSEISDEDKYEILLTIDELREKK